MLTPPERAQQARTKIKVDDVRRAIAAAWRGSASGAELRAALAAEGLTLARGDKAFVVIDQAGGVHELARALVAAAKAAGETLDKRAVQAEIAAKCDLGVDVSGVYDAKQEQRDERTAAQPAPSRGAKDPIELLVREKSVWSDVDLRAACRTVAGRAPGAAEALYEVTIARDDLISISKEPARLYTSKPLAEAEASLVSIARAAPADRAHVIPTAVAEKRVKDFCAAVLVRQGGFEVAAEQIGGILHLTSLTGAIGCLEGIAGGGKSTVIEGAAKLWTAADFRVEGAALAGKAAVNLKGAGIPATTLESWRIRFDRQEAFATRDLAAEWTAGRGQRTSVRASLIATLDWLKGAALRDRPQRKTWFDIATADLAKAATMNDLSRDVLEWIDGQIERQLKTRTDDKTILVVDEAGMVSTRQLDGIIRRARSVGAKVVLVGDTQQLQPIETGAAFRVVADELGSAQVVRVQRQRDGWMREATQGFKTGDPERAEAALRAYAEHDLISIGAAGTPDKEATIREAEAALGQALDQADRTRVGLVVDYAAARTEAGVAWGAIGRATAAGEIARPDDHPLYKSYVDAARRRADAARALAADIDRARPWLVRFGVDPLGFAADALAASGTRRRAATEQAPRYADELGLGAAADVKLNVDSRHLARGELISAWGVALAAAPEKSRLILSYTRADVSRLNADARAVMQSQGHLSGPQILITALRPSDHQHEPPGEKSLAIAIGDRLQCLENSGQQLKNGAFGTVEEIKHKEGKVLLKVKLDDQKEVVTIDTAKYRAIDYGYAATVHKSQGATVDQTFILAHKRFDLHLWYVAMSRHRDFARVYGAKTDFPTLQSLLRSAREKRSADAISDYCDPIRAAAGGVETPAERLAALSKDKMDDATGTARPGPAAQIGPAARAGHRSETLKPNPRGAGAEPPPTARGRVRDVSELALERLTDASRMLLPIEVRQPVDDSQSYTNGSVRRADSLKSQQEFEQMVELANKSVRTEVETEGLRRFVDGLRADADAGDHAAQYRLGKLLELGALGSPDSKAAAERYEQAARAQIPYPPALHDLAALCEHGSGVSRDPVRARALYERAAAAGYAPAQFWVATALRASDPTAAKELYSQIAPEKPAPAARERAGLRGAGTPLPVAQRIVHWEGIAATNERRWVAVLNTSKDNDLVFSVIAAGDVVTVDYTGGTKIIDDGKTITLIGEMTELRAAAIADAAAARGWWAPTATGTPEEKKALEDAVQPRVGITAPGQKTKLTTLDACYVQWTGIKDQFHDRTKQDRRTIDDRIINVCKTPTTVEVIFSDGSKIIDNGSQVKLTNGPLTPDRVHAILDAARAHGWTTLTLTGTDEEKKQLAVQAVRDGFRVSNPELQEFMKERYELAHKYVNEVRACNELIIDATRDGDHADLVDLGKWKRDAAGVVESNTLFGDIYKIDPEIYRQLLQHLGKIDDKIEAWASQLTPTVGESAAEISHDHEQDRGPSM